MTPGPEHAPHVELIERLYGGLDRHDGEAMAACYAPDAVFSDPAFGELRGDEVGGMWRMLCSRAERLDVELVEREAGETTGTARWIARYPFTATGNEVTNDVRSEFRFAGGLIAEQHDSFSFHRWSSQALGLPGKLLGWTPLMRAAIQRRARGDLTKFMSQAE